MSETTIACPRCKKEVQRDWLYCPRCAMALEDPAGAQTTLSDRIRYIRRESAHRSRRASLSRMLAKISTTIAILLVVGGGVVLFHPKMIPALFQPIESTTIATHVPKPGYAEEGSEEQPLLGFEWVLVPGGEFGKGLSEEAVSWKLPAFEIMKYEVTNYQWARYLNDEVQRERLIFEKKYADNIPRNWNVDPETEEPYPPQDLYGQPVTGITWEQAQEFCHKWLTNQPGCEGARLPTREEWEKAARGVEDDRPYPWGEEFYMTDPAFPDVLKARANTLEAGVRSPLPVTSFAGTDVSPYGVVGMAGNVAEFVGWPHNHAGFEGGAYNTDRFSARIGEYVELRSTDFSWRFVGFRAARQVQE